MKEISEKLDDIKDILYSLNLNISMIGANLSREMNPNQIGPFYGDHHFDEEINRLDNILTDKEKRKPDLKTFVLDRPV